MYTMPHFQTTSEAYMFTLHNLLKYPDAICWPRGQTVFEISDYCFKVEKPSSDPIVTKDLERNKIIARYTAQEVDLYNSMSNRVEDFAKASKFWEKIANPDGTINSAYGYLIWGNKSLGNPNFESVKVTKAAFDFSLVTEEPVYRTPWEWCVKALKDDMHTRQAVLRFSLPEHHYSGNLDFTCTMHANFSIRGEELNLSVMMRSNDVVKGMAYDMPWFCSLMDKMLLDLKDTYPLLKKGKYTHMVHSMHAYGKDFPVIRKMLGE